MSLNSNSDSRPSKPQMQLPIMRCEPLLSRMGSLVRGLEKETGIECQLSAKNTSHGFTLKPPFFTRLTSDAGLAVQAKRQLLAELAPFGVAWVGDAMGSIEHKSDDSTGEPLRLLPRIASLQLDEPIDIAILRQAAAIELQLCGVPFQSLANSRRARWTPGLPVEITDFEQLEKRVDVLRVLSGGKSPIGALVSPAAVYEDVRFLIDSGFDFLTMIVDVQFGMPSTSSLRLASLDATIEQSVKAVEDSGANTKILVSASLLDGQQMFRCLQMGISAVSIDAFLAHSKPKETAAAKETFGSVLSSYTPANASSPMAWVKSALTQLIDELNDYSVYAGTWAAVNQSRMP